MPIIIESPTLPARYQLLELVQQVCAELGLTQPAYVVGNDDPQTAQMLALLNRLGRDLARQFEWQRLTKEYIFTSVDGQALYDFPSDWARQIPQTEWDRSSHWPLVGPATSQQWQVYKSGVISQGPRLRFRIAGGGFEIFPAIGGYELVFNYISSHWVIAADSQTSREFRNDTDTCVFEDSLMISGLKALWKAAKGLDASFDMSEFRITLEQCKAQDKSAPVLSIAPQPRSFLIGMGNVVDGNYPAS